MTDDLAANRAELRRALAEKPGPLGARDHAAYIGALRRRLARLDRDAQRGTAR